MNDITHSGVTSLTALTNPLATAALSTPSTATWATSLAPATAVSAATLACSFVFWATGRQETGNCSAPLSWLMHHNSNISVLTDFFLWDWNVCWHTVWSPVLTLVTTPSIVLFPGKEERNVETFTAFNQRLKLSFMSHQNICWDVDESSPRHVMNSVMSNMLNRNSREVLRRWFCSVDCVTLVSPSCMFWSRCIVTF